MESNPAQLTEHNKVERVVNVYSKNHGIDACSKQVSGSANY